MTVEDASADIVAAEKFAQQLQHIIEERGYSPTNFNTEQTALFWKNLASGTYIS
jgi:predicted transcriptional regulator